jgi:hypothetical protein
MYYGYDDDGYEADCVCCVRDAGFDMNDVRATFYAGGPDYYEEGWEDAEPARVLRIVVKRVYIPCAVCDGEYGMDYRVVYEVTDSAHEGTRVPFPEMDMAYAYIAAVCPGAEEDEGWIAEDTGMRHW